MEMLDIVVLKQIKLFGTMIEDTVVDLSQALQRTKPCITHVNQIGTPTTSQEFFHLGEKRFLVAGELFKMQGWSGALDLTSVPAGAWRTLTGNMMSLPCVGAVMASAISSVNLSSRVGGPKDFRRGQS